MSDLDAAVEQLVTANRIVAHENVCDSYGHVSIRHPDNANRYLLAYSKSPSIVEAEDIVTFELDGTPVDLGDRTPYSERAIHGAIYEQRPDVNSVVHNHSYQVVPFTVSSIQLQPIIHVAARIGDPPPTWDIKDKFGDDVIIKKFEKSKGWLAKRISSENQIDMIANVIEERSIWQRYGL